MVLLHFGGLLHFPRGAPCKRHDLESVFKCSWRYSSVVVASCECHSLLLTNVPGVAPFVLYCSIVRVGLPEFPVLQQVHGFELRQLLQEHSRLWHSVGSKFMLATTTILPPLWCSLPLQIGLLLLCHIHWCIHNSLRDSAQAVPAVSNVLSCRVSTINWNSCTAS